MEILEKHPRPCSVTALLHGFIADDNDFLILDANKKPVSFPRVKMSEGFYIWEKTTAELIMKAINSYDLTKERVIG